MFLLKVLVLLVTYTFVHSVDYTPLVRTHDGFVFGYYKTSFKGRNYTAYEGIPYAQAPTGNHRFEEPIPIRPWLLLNATSYKPKCAQYGDIPPNENGQYETKNRITGEDDCLYLNIYTPVLEGRNKKKLPVIFFIHGGSYQYGSAHDALPTYIMDRNVTYVSINYRLGIQGFLSTEDEVLPGNLGLKDQNVALRWVSNNIEHFGGDPKQITIVGFSAGSSSVQYHYLSPMSRGLFRSGIAISGTVFNPWGFAKNSREKAKKLGAIFDCPTDNSRKMIDCLKKVPAQKLAGATKEFQPFQYEPEAPFAPVVEKAGKNPFISVSPEELLRSKAVYNAPIVYTTVLNEGGDPSAAYIPHDNIMKDLNDNWIDIAPHLLQYNYTLPLNLHEELAIASREEYFGNETIDESTGTQLTKILTDKHFHMDIGKAVKLHARATKSPVYFYIFTRRGSQSFTEFLSHTKNNYGVVHSDDYNLVVGNPLIYANNTPADYKMSNFLTDIWESVAYNRIPKISVKWDPVDPNGEKLNYLHIADVDDYSMSEVSNFGNIKFWSKYLKN